MGVEGGPDVGADAIAEGCAGKDAAVSETAEEAELLAAMPSWEGEERDEFSSSSSSSSAAFVALAVVVVGIAIAGAGAATEDDVMLEARGKVEVEVEDVWSSGVGEEEEPAALSPFSAGDRHLLRSWIFLWRVSSSERAKRRSQPSSEHTNGRSPVWVRMCVVR